MLHITMAQGEYVVISDNIKVYYDRLKGNNELVLTFDAPREVKILRQKIYEETLANEIGADTLEGEKIAEKLRTEREALDRAAELREEKRKERNRVKRELRRAAN